MTVGHLFVLPHGANKHRRKTEICARIAGFQHKFKETTQTIEIRIETRFKFESDSSDRIWVGLGSNSYNRIQAVNYYYLSLYVLFLGSCLADDVPGSDWGEISFAMFISATLCCGCSSASATRSSSESEKLKTNIINKRQKEPPILVQSTPKVTVHWILGAFLARKFVLVMP